MGISQFWLHMADKEIKIHRRVIRMIFPMIQRAKNNRSVRTALYVDDNGVTAVSTCYSLVDLRHYYSILSTFDCNFGNFSSCHSSNRSGPLLLLDSTGREIGADSCQCRQMNQSTTNQQNDPCDQRRLRSAWASVQSDHSLCCPHGEAMCS